MWPFFLFLCHRQLSSNSAESKSLGAGKRPNDMGSVHTAIYRDKRERLEDKWAEFIIYFTSGNIESHSAENMQPRAGMLTYDALSPAFRANLALRSNPNQQQHSKFG